MSEVVPDTSGLNVVFDEVTDKAQWFTANATSDTTIAAGVWNASLNAKSLMGNCLFSSNL